MDWFVAVLGGDVEYCWRGDSLRTGERAASEGEEVLVRVLIEVEVEDVVIGVTGELEVDVAVAVEGGS